MWKGSSLILHVYGTIDYHRQSRDGEILEMAITVARDCAEIQVQGVHRSIRNAVVASSRNEIATIYKSRKRFR